MKNFLSNILIGVLIIVLLVSVSSGIVFLAEYLLAVPNKQEREKHRQERYNDYYQMGYNAQKADVPANANPAKTGTSDALAWLEGWIASKKESK